MAKKKSLEYVVLATDKRGVFAGLLKSYDRKARIAVLTQARQCVYWSSPTRGFLGLAASGPQEGSRVSNSAPSVELPGVQCVATCSPEARKAWESDQWA